MYKRNMFILHLLSMKKYVYETDFNDDDDGDIGGLGLAFLSFSIYSSKIFAPVFVCLEIDEELSRISLGPTSMVFTRYV